MLLALVTGKTFAERRYHDFIHYCKCPREEKPRLSLSIYQCPDSNQKRRSSLDRYTVYHDILACMEGMEDGRRSKYSVPGISCI